MQFKQYSETKKDGMPPLLTVGDSFKTITKIDVKNIDYQGKPTAVGTVTTDRGIFGTFSGVIIKTLQEFFNEHPTEIMENVKVVQPRGKQYLSLEAL